jgi:cytochrome c oxidase subunit 3
MILLLSGCTITWAHHSLIENDHKGLLTGLGLTVILGVAFTATQLWEYTHSPFKFYGGGIYPSVFFLATGFHGFHVIVGTSFLIVCWFRARVGQFTPQRHFGFEAAAWYWHFVDVVWLFLFTCIYWWGASAIVAGP